MVGGGGGGGGGNTSNYIELVNHYEGLGACPSPDILWYFRALRQLLVQFEAKVLIITDLVHVHIVFSGANMSKKCVCVCVGGGGGGGGRQLPPVLHHCFFSLSLSPCHESHFQ